MYIITYSCVCVLLTDMVICLQDYIFVKEKGAKFLPHTAGRYAVKRFRKAQVNISHYKFPT